MGTETSDSDVLEEESTVMAPSVTRTGAAGWLAALAADCFEAEEPTVRGVKEIAWVSSVVVETRISLSPEDIL